MKSAVSTRGMRGPGDLAPGAYGQSGYVIGFGNHEPESIEQQRTRLQQHAGKYDAPHPDDDDLGEHDWMLTYTDMVTLLMAFFVILTAIAMANTSKSESQSATAQQYVDGTVPTVRENIYGTGPTSPFDGRGFTIAEYGEAANQDPVASRYDDPDVATPSTTDAAPSGEAHSGSTLSGNPVPMQSTPTPQLQPPVIPEPPQPQMSTQLAQQLQSMVNQNSLGSQVEVISAGDSVTLRISDKILFASGRANLEVTGQDLVKKLSTILAESGGMISIEGHTDNIPISTSQYPSNWELSAARAAMVLRQLVSLGLPANKLRAIAYADTKPVNPNTSSDNRASNRRVELVISSAPGLPPL